MVVYDKDKKELTIPIGWGAIEDIPRDYSTVPLGVKFPNGGSFYCCKGGGTEQVYDKYFYVSVNGGEWQKRSNLETEADKLILNAGDTLRFKGENTNYGSYNRVYGAFTRFVIEGEGAEISGNIMSLCYGDNFSGVTEHNYECLFPYLFAGSSISNVENLILPIKNVSMFGYWGMFSECTNLAKSPLIEAESIGYKAMGWMFNGCSNLKEIRCRLSSGFEEELSLWVKGVFPNGIFYGKNVNDWETGNNGIPEGWEKIEIQA